MNKSTKVAVVLGVLMSFALGYASIVWTGAAGPGDVTPQPRGDFGSSVMDAKQGDFRVGAEFGLNSDPQPAHKPAGYLRHLLGGEPTTVEGTAVALVRNVLVVETSDGGTVRIVLPRAWLVDGEPVRVGHLVEGGFLSAGDDVSVTSLKSERSIDETGVTISVVFGYELSNLTTGQDAEAVLPFNIETG